MSQKPFLVNLSELRSVPSSWSNGKEMEKNSGNKPDTCKPDVFRAIDEDMEASQQ